MIKALGLVFTACSGTHFGTLVYMDAQLPRPGCSGEGLGLLIGQGSLPSLKQGGEGGGSMGVCEGIGRREGSVNN